MRFLPTHPIARRLSLAALLATLLATLPATPASGFSVNTRLEREGWSQLMPDWMPWLLGALAVIALGFAARAVIERRRYGRWEGYVDDESPAPDEDDAPGGEDTP